MKQEPYLVGSILFGADEEIAAYVAKKIGRRQPFEKFTALGVVRRGVPVGGIVYHNYQDWGCIEVSLAFDSPLWCTPQTLRGLFAYPFIGLRCVRMTAVVARRNKRSRRLVKGLGFKEEGVARRGYDGRDDAVGYGLLRGECRFIKDKT